MIAANGHELRSDGSVSRFGLGVCATMFVHGLLVLSAFNAKPEPIALSLPPLEVELAPEPEPAPPAEPEPVTPPPPETQAQDAPKVEPAAPRPPRPAAPAPARDHREKAPTPQEPPQDSPAAAGALHTANEDAPSTSEPVRFAVDPHGAAFGFGTVVQGGQGTGRGGVGAARQAVPQAAAGAATTGRGNHDSAQLRHFAVPPRLDESDPCRGYFPSMATADRAEVTLRLVVSAQGVVLRASVLNEQPSSQGFGDAAVRCLRSKRFVPARNEDGQPQKSEAPVAVRFRR